MIYGTTYRGGRGNRGGHGVAFQLTPPAAPGDTWTNATIYEFGSPADSKTLVFWNGVLYGARFGVLDQHGGEHQGDNGAIFQLTPPAGSSRGAWTYQELYAFAGGKDARNPYGFILDNNGVMYGVSAQGGNGCRRANGCGTVFQLTPPAAAGGRWTEKVLCVFRGSADGENPNGLAFNGSHLVGTTYAGGTSDACPNGYYTGCGTVFQLSPPAGLPPEPGGAWVHTVLYDYSGNDGSYPQGLLAVNGAFFGTTLGGGNLGCISDYSPSSGCGSVFQVRF